MTSIGYTADQFVIILLGAPGSGKGTQATRICQSLHIPHISTGDLFRDNMKNNTPLGQEARGFIEAGKLVPDALVLDMLFQRVSENDCKNGYLLDGFPRTLAQAVDFEKKLKPATKQIVISIQVPDSEVIKRISGRWICPGCNRVYHQQISAPKEGNLCNVCQIPLQQRKDDAKEVIEQRLKVYHEQTKPVENYYKAKGILHEVNGNQDQHIVFKDLMMYIELVNAP